MVLGVVLNAMQVGTGHIQVDPDSVDELSGFHRLALLERLARGTYICLATTTGAFASLPTTV